MITPEDASAKLASADEVDRIYAAEDLGFSTDPRAPEILINALGLEPSTAVREAIFLALEQSRAPGVLEQVARLLQSDSAFVRNHAITVLQARDDEAAELLVARYAGETADVRKLILDTLATSDTELVTKVLSAGLKDACLNVVIAAVEHVGDYRRVALVPEVEVLLETGGQPQLLAACLEALAACGMEESRGVLLRRFPRFGTVPSFLRPQWVRALAALGAPGDIKLLVGAAAAEPELVASLADALLVLKRRFDRVKAPELRDVVAVLAEAPSVPELTRYQLIRALALFEGRECLLRALTAHLRSPVPVLRLGAAEAVLGAGLGAELAPLVAEVLKSETDPDVRVVLEEVSKS